ncbi:MAG: hypothetical protein WC508_00745 [Patescibacteria group bacterium]
MVNLRTSRLWTLRIVAIGITIALIPWVFPIPEAYDNQRWTELVLTGLALAGLIALLIRILVSSITANFILALLRWLCNIAIVVSIVGFFGLCILGHFLPKDQFAAQPWATMGLIGFMFLCGAAANFRLKL